jgi:hypothetical protein
MLSLTILKFMAIIISIKLSIWCFHDCEDLYRIFWIKIWYYNPEEHIIHYMAAYFLGHLETHFHQLRLGYLELNIIMIVNNNMEQIFKEAIVAYYKIL